MRGWKTKWQECDKGKCKVLIFPKSEIQQFPNSWLKIRTWASLHLEPTPRWPPPPWPSECLFSGRQADTLTCSERKQESNLQEIIAGRCVLVSSGEHRLFLSVSQPTQLPLCSTALGKGAPTAQGGQLPSDTRLREANPSESQL